MKIDLPANVLLRCNRNAIVTAPADAAPFKVFGRSENGVELWQRDGHWREDRTPHPLDIVGVVDPAAGKLVPLTDHFARQ